MCGNGLCRAPRRICDDVRARPVLGVTLRCDLRSPLADPRPKEHTMKTGGRRSATLSSCSRRGRAATGRASSSAPDLGDPCDGGCRSGPHRNRPVPGAFAPRVAVVHGGAAVRGPTGTGLEAGAGGRRGDDGPQRNPLPSRRDSCGNDVRAGRPSPIRKRVGSESLSKEDNEGVAAWVGNATAALSSRPMTGSSPVGPWTAMSRLSPCSSAGTRR